MRVLMYVLTIISYFKIYSKVARKLDTMETVHIEEYTMRTHLFHPKTSHQRITHVLQ